MYFHEIHILVYTHTHTSFIIMSNKGRLPALGLGAERPAYTSIHNCILFLKFEKKVNTGIYSDQYILFDVIHVL